MNKHNKVFGVPIGKRVKFTEEQLLKLHFTAATYKVFKTLEDREKRLLNSINTMGKTIR